MPLYDLFVISKTVTPSLDAGLLRNTIKRTASLLLEREAIVKNVEYLGTQKLPYRMKLKDAYVYHGSYWQLQFFSSPALLEQMKFNLKYDPDVIRFTFLKRADTLKHYIGA